MGSDLVSLVDKFSGVKVLVAGDAILDAYHFGTVERISPEAPVPVFVEDYSRQEVRRGGADNVAHQLEAWGCEVTTIFPKRRSAKHRYLVDHHQVFRRDSDSHEEADVIMGKLTDPQVVVLSDYGKGFLTPQLCQVLIGAAGDMGIPIVVDPKGSDWSRYSGASVICPNEKEMIAHPLCFPRIVLKRGQWGIELIEGSQRTTVPARKVPVFDVTGAGDCVVAAISVCLGSGIGSLETAAQIAVAAASVVVQKVGTSICTLEELKCALGSPMGSTTSATPATRTSSNGAGVTATTSSWPSTPTEVRAFLRGMGDHDES